MKCIICGTEENVRTTELPHGTINLCTKQLCTRLLTYKTEGSVPLVWFGFDDLLEHEEFTKEQLELFTDEDIVDASYAVSDYLWESGLTDTFGDALTTGAEEMEFALIFNTPQDRLPLG
jgi:hypothetical protein